MANDIQLKLLKTGVARWNRWRSKSIQTKIDLSGADLSELHLNRVNLSNAILCGANFSGAHLNQADLNSADLSGATLSDVHLNRASLTQAILNDTNLTRTNLNRSQMTGASLHNAQLIAADLSGADLSGANLHGANLIGADLSDAKLQWVNFKNANLIGADLTEADLTNANLSYTQALATDFTSARLTGVCLECWNTNSSTQLSDVECHYVYLQEAVQERRPRIGEFAQGEFTRLFQKALETADLTFPDGIDWTAFFDAFKKVQAESGDAELSIQAIEKQDDGVLVIKIQVPPQTSKAGTKEFLRREYKRRLNAIAQPQRQDIPISRQSNADLVEIISMLASKSPQFDVKLSGNGNGNRLARLSGFPYLKNSPVISSEENGSHPDSSSVQVTEPLQNN